MTLPPYLALHVLLQAGKGERWSVCIGHKQPLQDNLVEVAVCPPYKEAIKLHTQQQVIYSADLMCCCGLLNTPMKKTELLMCSCAAQLL